MAYIDQATTLLSTAAGALKTVYHPETFDVTTRFGKGLQRLFNPSKRRVEGNGIQVKVQTRRAYPARMGRNINGAFPKPRTVKIDSFTATLSEEEGSNDFSRISASVSVTHLDLERGRATEASAIDFVKRTVQQVQEHRQETMSIHRHADTTALIALVNGTAKKLDARTLASASAIASTGGARFAIDGGSISALPPGLHLDVFPSGSNTKRFTVQVIDFNPDDSSVGVYGVDATDEEASSSIDISTIADNDELYISGEKGKGLISIGAWFGTPTSGETFLTRDRTTADYFWMRPWSFSPSSSTPLLPGHIDDAVIKFGFTQEDPENGFIALTTPGLEQRYRNIIGQDTMIQMPTSAEKGKLLATYGFDGNLYRHPLLGRIMLQSDPLAPDNKIRFLKPGDWETLAGLPDQWQWLPGDNDMWYRVDSGTPGEGRSTVYRADGMGLFCEVCTAPQDQMEIANVTA